MPKGCAFIDGHRADAAIRLLDREDTRIDAPAVARIHLLGEFFYLAPLAFIAKSTSVRHCGDPAPFVGTRRAGAWGNDQEANDEAGGPGLPP